MITPEHILSPDFQLTKDNQIQVSYYLNDLNDPGAYDVYLYVSKLDTDVLIDLLKASFLEAEKKNESEWMFTMYRMMQHRNITFEDLQIAFPDRLKQILIQIGE